MEHGVTLVLLGRWAEIIRKMDFFLTQEVDGKEFIVVHAGYTPTFLSEEFPFNDGNVFRMYDPELDCTFYDIDCGCFAKGRRENAKMACLRLEGEEIFYV